MFPRPSISRNLTLGLSCIVLLLSGIGLFLNQYFVLQKGQTRLEDMGREYVDVVGEALKFPLWNLSIENIEITARAYTTNELVVKLTVFDAVDNVVFSFDRSTELHPATEHRKTIVYEGETVGRVELSLTDHFLKQSQRHVLVTGGITLSITLLSLLVLTRLLLLRFLKFPLNALKQIAGQYAQGVYHQSTNSLQYVEFDEFLAVLGTMGRKIETQMETLKSSNIRLAEAEAKYRGIFENALEGLFQLSMTGRIISANPALAHILGYASIRSMVRELNILDVHLFPDPQKRRDFFDRLNTRGKVADYEIEGLRQDQTVFWGALTLRRATAPETQTAYLEGSLIDITERKSREKAEREREAALMASEAKSMFVANMSHEIRTPMNAIIGMATLASRTELTPKQKDYLSKIEASAQSLLQIINDILDFSKIEAGRLNMETIEFDLEKVLDELSGIIGLKAEEKGLDLIFDVAEDVPLGLVGDPLRLGQVLINLSSNAVKFTEKGQIIIQVRLAQPPARKVETDLAGPDDRENVRLRFSVIDTGIGLKPEQIRNLFESFQQADVSTTRKYGGTGLGLAISKRIVEMMQGEFKVESTYGAGSAFSFTACFGLHANIKQATALPEDMRGMRVLVVDDNSAAREILSEALTSLSFDVTQVASAAEALAEIENTVDSDPYKLVLMDWKMPEMDGLEATRRIKTNPRLKDIPAVLMVTAYGHGEIRKMAEDVGNDAFLVKPVTPSLLYETILKIFAGDNATGKEKPEAAALDIAGLEDIRGAKILLVEDNEINQQVATELLMYEGFHVSVADNGRIALDMLTTESGADGFDVILMDIQMAEMDGYTATRNIKALPKPVCDIPVIAMTAHAMEKERRMCLEAGMIDFISKPIDPHRLLTILVKWIPPGKRELPQGFAVETEQIEETILPATIPGFDIKTGLERVRGNRKLYLDLLLTFFHKHQDAKAEMARALETFDFDSIWQKAHAVKGAAGNLGADALSLAAANIEQSAREKTLNDAHPSWGAYLDHFERVMAELRKIDQRRNDSQKPKSVTERPVKPEKLLPMVSAIQERMEKDYAGAMEQVRRLEKHAAGTPLADDVDQLIQLIDDFEMEEAHACLGTIARKLAPDRAGE